MKITIEEIGYSQNNTCTSKLDKVILQRNMIKPFLTFYTEKTKVGPSENT